MQFLKRQKGQGMVEFALILALVALIVIVALIATGGQVINLYSDIVQTMCLYHAGCWRTGSGSSPRSRPPRPQPPAEHCFESAPCRGAPAPPAERARSSAQPPARPAAGSRACLQSARRLRPRTELHPSGRSATVCIPDRRRDLPEKP